MTTETTQEARAIAITPEMLAEALDGFWLDIRDDGREARGQVANPVEMADELHATLSRNAAELGEGNELAKFRNACKHMGSVIVSMSRQMECARIEMLQNGPEAAMQWILNSIPDVDDNEPEDRWNGTESAGEWFDRTREAAK